jgi:hypothetical protein
MGKMRGERDGVGRTGGWVEVGRMGEEYMQGGFVWGLRLLVGREELGIFIYIAGRGGGERFGRDFRCR